MIINSKKIYLIFTILGVVLLCYFAAMFSEYRKKQQISAASFLVGVGARLISNYNKEHGDFPMSVDGYLPVELVKYNDLHSRYDNHSDFIPIDVFSLDMKKPLYSYNVFRDDSLTKVRGNPLRYQYNSEIAMVVSMGPDMDYDIGGDALVANNLCKGVMPKKLVMQLYDATNGISSSGDIFMWICK